VQSVQTNSLNPQFIIINGLNVKTEDYSTNIDGVITDYLSSAERVFGFVHSDEVVSMMHGGLSSASSWRDASLISATGVSFYDGANGVSATLRSWNTATGGFSYWQARTVDINSYDGMKISYCAVGVAANAPGHFMGQDGQSVFLTSNEFGDDLLLSGGAAGGGGGPSSPPPGGGSGGNAVGNREFWTDIDRDFPTQINTIRDFPIY